MRFCLVFSCALLLATSAVAAVDDRHGEPEPILGLWISSDGLEFQVRSWGCTEKEDFSVERFGDGNTVHLLLVRDFDDHCLVLVPFGQRIVFSWEELGFSAGETRFDVLNEVSPTIISLPECGDPRDQRTAP